MKSTAPRREVVEVLPDADQPDAAAWQRQEQIASDRAREWLRRIHSGGPMTLAEYMRADQLLAALSPRHRGCR